MLFCFLFLFSSVSVVKANEIVAGTQISENTNFPDSDANYQVTFTYEVTDENVVKVDLIGNFQFYDQARVNDYKNGGTSYQTYLPFDYKLGMVNTSYDISGSSAIPINMNEVQENIYSVTIPLPGDQYLYQYQLTYNGGTVTSVMDSTNLSYTASNGSNCKWSYIYVESKDDCLAGQEYIYPRQDGKTGKVEYIEYTTSYGIDELIPVYTPYGYDSSKEYKTLYLNGSEYEWFFVGSAANIIDNLIAEGLLAECIVVGTNVISPFNVDVENGYKIGVENTVNTIIPLIESNYSVSTDPNDRAICGLSANGASVHTLIGMYPEAFGYYAAFSSGPENVVLDPEILN